MKKNKDSTTTLLLRPSQELRPAVSCQTNEPYDQRTGSLCMLYSPRKANETASPAGDVHQMLV